MIDKVGHYSLTAPGSVYDEEALTALELAARTAKKVNECVDLVNENEANVKQAIEEQIPETIAEDVEKHIKSGTFDAQFDKHTAELIERITEAEHAATQYQHEVVEQGDEFQRMLAEYETVTNARINGIASLAEGSTTGDAELIDLRTDYRGATHANAGEAVRYQTERLNNNVNVSRDIGLRDLFVIYDSDYVDASATNPDYYHQMFGAIRNIEVITYDKTSPLKVRLLSRNNASFKYRIIISQLSADGVNWTDIIDTGSGYTVEENENGLTHIEYITNGNFLKMDIAYDTLIEGESYNHGGLNAAHYIINPNCVKTHADAVGEYDMQLLPVFQVWDATYTASKATLDNYINVLGGIHSVELYGFDSTKPTKIRYFCRNNADMKYRIILSQLTNDGVNWVDVFDTSKNFTVTENPNGFTVVNYSNTDGKRVTMLVDYRKITDGIAYMDGALTDGRYILSPFCFKDMSSTASGNVLNGKKYVAIGDSFTESCPENFSDGELYNGMPKTYPYYIGNRNDMTIINMSRGGSTITTIENREQMQFSNGVYLKIPTDADYITIKYGINDHTLRVPLGTIDSTDVTTFYGAYNTVMEHIVTNMPYAKVGLIVTNGVSGSTGKQFAQAIRDIARKWGVPYLDEAGSDQVPLPHRTCKDDVVCETALNARVLAFRVSETDTHPNAKAHEYESTIVENFLRGL